MDFFKGSKAQERPGFWILTSSLVISWLFSKSLTNAANLGLSFGIVGGIAYASYYLSFIVAGIIIYRLRTKGNFQSIHHFLESKFGKKSLLLFSVLIGFRLLNEVWSNTMVIGSYFGPSGSTPYFSSIVIFTLLTLIYALKGGMRSSLLTDLIQMIFFVILLSIILYSILPDAKMSASSIVHSGDWTMTGGINLLWVGLIQIFSYPFHDPVMTDRGFISDEKTTLKGFIWAAVIGGLSIILFSFVGIYGKVHDLTGQAPVEVAKLLGLGMTLVVNFIMITSAASTLDSTFNSFAKLWVLDLSSTNSYSISKGRLAMIFLVVIGTIPIFLGAEILSATTISGTMVLGLMPIFLFWNDNAPKASYYLSIIGGIVIGVLYTLNIDLHSPFIGKYADLLWVNILGSIMVLVLYFTPKYVSNYAKS